MSLEALEKEFLTVRPLYEALGVQIQDKLKPALLEAGISDATVTSRAKEADEFLKKTIRKPYTDPMAEITDKVGVRIVVSLLAHVPIVEDVIRSLFPDIFERSDKADDLEDNELGYLGVHYLIRGTSELDVGNFEMNGHICEIQIHTRAQNAWSSVSHPLLYKPGGARPSTTTRRRINRLVALVELFDQEVEEARSQVMEDQDVQEVRMLDAIDRPFTRLIGRGYDPALSLFILRVIKDAFTDAELNRFAELMADFTKSNGEYFADRVRSELQSGSANPLLAQPEALVVLERLKHSGLTLRAAWDRHLDPLLLTRLSESLGRPLEPA